VSRRLALRLFPASLALAVMLGCESYPLVARHDSTDWEPGPGDAGPETGPDVVIDWDASVGDTGGPDATRPATCGDGILDDGEQCDDGNNVSDDGCNAQCVREYCGDGVRQSSLSEECDDGNYYSGDGCSPYCVVEIFW
jgi:cysteine-rich repeat protein